MNNYASSSDYYDSITRDIGVFYTTNPNYYENYIQAVIENADNFPVAEQTFETEDQTNNYSLLDSTLYFNNNNVKENEIILTYTIYNELFGTSCSSSNLADFESKDIIYKAYDVYSNALIEKKLTIKSLASSCYAHKSLLPSLAKNQFKKVGAYFTGISEMGKFFTHAEELKLSIITSNTAVVKMAVKCIAIFKDLFKLLSFIMVISVLVLIVVNTINILNRNIYNIGVSRSLGAHVNELGFIYSLQMLLFGIFVIVFSTITDYLSIKLINKLLSSTIPKVIELPGVESITYLYFNPSLTMSITSVLVVLTIISIFVPILAIKLMNPVNIIKKKS